MHRAPELILVGLLTLGVTHGFLFGKPEASDNEQRAPSARSMLDNLYKAAKERADRIRETEGTKAGPLGGKDILSSLVDYASDRIKNPPLRSTERNFLALQKDLRTVAAEVIELRRALANVTAELIRRDLDVLQTDPKSKCQAVMRSKLVSVQGPKYTEIDSSP